MNKKIKYKDNLEKKNRNNWISNLINKYNNKEDNIEKNTKNISFLRENNLKKNEQKYFQEKETKKSIKLLNKSKIEENNKWNEINFDEEIKILIQNSLNNKLYNINKESFEVPPKLELDEYLDELKNILESKTMNDDKKLNIYKTEIFDINNINKKDKKIFKKKEKVSSYFALLEKIIDSEIEILKNYYESKGNKNENFIKFINNFYIMIRKIIKKLIEEYKSFRYKYNYKTNKTNIYNKNQNIYLKSFLKDLKNINIEYEKNKNEMNIDENNIKFIENKLINIKNENSNNIFVNDKYYKNDIKIIHKNVLNKINSNLSNKFNIVNSLNLDIQKVLKRIHKIEEKSLLIKRKLWHKTYDRISDLLDDNPNDLLNNFIQNN